MVRCDWLCSWECACTLTGMFLACVCLYGDVNVQLKCARFLRAGCEHTRDGKMPQTALARDEAFPHVYEARGGSGVVEGGEVRLGAWQGHEAEGSRYKEGHGFSTDRKQA